ncbi:hypothetical protein QBC35DRAFT_83053 [Podospora australis]|uniref:IPT/TIG domain-containing protein n=1 Tax=Podospora australis TaxID=1536484 RepID=A0AAN6WM26_9PEZI|nr:hypothetical protein QBC35DRAFT_83053 [Podospora australis]
MNSINMFDDPEFTSFGEYIDPDGSPESGIALHYNSHEPLPDLSARNSLSESQSHSSIDPVNTPLTTFTSAIDPTAIAGHTKSEFGLDTFSSTYGGEMQAGGSPMSGNGHIDMTQQILPHTGIDTNSVFQFESNANSPVFQFEHNRNGSVPELSREGSPFSPAMSSHISPIQPFHGLPDGPFQWPQFNPNAMSQAMPMHLPFTNPTVHYNAPIPHMRIEQNMHKSRVETQITIRLFLSNLPSNVTKLHLPTWTISKPKFLAKSGQGEPNPNMLELHVRLVCTSAITRSDETRRRALDVARQAARMPRRRPLLPSEDGSDEALKPQDGGDVTICSNCVVREHKRSSRKKNSKNAEDEEAWKRDENYRVIVFNTEEVKEWLPAEVGEHKVEAPMRIACYCRHHQEKEGFNVIFTLTDWQGKMVAQAMSGAIMITDDHKNGHAVATASESARRNSQAGAYASPPEQHLSPGQSQPQLTPTSRVLSRPASPGFTQQQPKKRKTNPSPKNPVLTMTRINTAQSPPGHLNGQPRSAALTPGSSPSPPSDMASYLISGTLAQEQSGMMLFGNGSPSPIQNQQQPQAGLNGTANFGSIYPGSMSIQPSRSGSPISHLNTPLTNTQPSPHLSQQMPQMFDMGSLLAQPTPPSPAPQILKVIPYEGSTTGNYEVSVFGHGFTNTGLTVMFGDQQATTTTYWGSTSLVCLVPPHAPGWVRVTIKDHRVPQDHQAIVFHYKESAETDILRNAFAILTQKLGGKQGDMASFAKQVMDSHGQSQSGALPGGGMSGGGGMFNSHATGSELEEKLMKFVELMDSDKSRAAHFDLQRSSTKQTVLHLASYLGLHRFARSLLERGANPLMRDRAGYTPLHMAAWRGKADMVQLLIDHGADPSLRTLSGSTAADLCVSEEIKQILDCVEQHRGVKGGPGPLQRRASSAISLESLPGPLSGPQSEAEDLDSDEETDDEDSSFASSDEAAFSEEEPTSSLHMRSTTAHLPHTSHENNMEPRPRRGTDGLGSLEAAVAAIKDQMTAHFQVLQQSMQMSLQHLPLPQFPNLRQIPNMPNLPQIPNMPDYQAALVQRLLSMVPTAANNSQPSQDPPAYDEVCPQSALDKKQSSAARAALDAEADAKCAAVFGEASTSKVEAESSTTKVKVISEGAETIEAQEVDDILPVLEIGRKHAITQEQQDTLRRAHAEKRRPMSRDKNLFFIWLPLLVFMVALMVFNPLQHLVPSRQDFLNTMGGLQTAAAELMPERVRAVGL